MKPIRHFKHNTCHFIRILLSTLPPACTRSFLTVFSAWKQLCSLYLIIIWNYHTICNYLVSWRSKNKQQMQIFINCQTPTTLPHIIIMTSFRSTEGEWWCIYQFILSELFSIWSNVVTDIFQFIQTKGSIKERRWLCGYFGVNNILCLCL